MLRAVASDDVRRYDEPRAVLVRHTDGAWYTGFCEGWSRWPDGSWRASVTYTVGIGERYIRSVPADRVELAEE